MDAIGLEPIEAGNEGERNGRRHSSTSPAISPDFCDSSLDSSPEANTAHDEGAVMKQQHTLMKFDPAHGEEKPYPSNADDWRAYHGTRAWLFNPWTGDARSADDIGDDVHGLLIMPPGEPVYAASSTPKLSEVPDGFVLLPKEPTQEMTNAFNSGSGYLTWGDCYRRMIATAQAAGVNASAALSAGEVK